MKASTTLCIVGVISRIGLPITKACTFIYVKMKWGHDVTRLACQHVVDACGSLVVPNPR